MLDIRFEDHKPFIVWGYSVETNLENGDQDVGKLWSDYKNELLSLPATSPGLYGIMWYTDNTHKQYFYMLAVHVDDREEHLSNNNIQCLEIPNGLFAVASLPDDADLREAWTDFYFKELPARKLETNYKHGIFFEYYPVAGGIELWNPVKQI
ncbi:MAG: GyrI-like domain-containing protein [Bacteroides sp.]|nr:GyrI-like domain-containing protein [Bacteroides sp.]